MRWFRKQPTIARAMVGFVMIATVLCLLFGPIGMLYALGFEVLYLVTIGFAALLDPDRTAIGFKVGRRFQLGQRYARIVPTGDIKRFDSAKRPLSTAGSTDQRNTLILFQRWSVVMKQRRRIYYSAAQRSEIWDRWQAGEPMSSIGRRFDRESSSVFSVISPTGGIRPPDRH